MASGAGTSGFDLHFEASAVRRVDYQEWADSLDWLQGEHFTLIGPTGSGKSTTAIEELLPRRRFVIALITKRKDPVVWDLADRGYDVFRDWRDVPAEVSSRIVLAPPSKGVHDLDRQRDAFRRALAAAYYQGGWTIYLDETRYVTDFLGLQKDVELLWHQGRSEGTTVVAGGQRPRHLPLLAYSQASHLLLWKTNDHQDLRRIGEFGGVNRDELAREVGDLEWNVLGRNRTGQFDIQAEHLHLDTRTDRMTRTLPPDRR